MTLIKQIPLPICGLMLALFSLGNLLNDTHPILKIFFGILGVIVLALVILKIILYSDNVKNDFKNPVIVSSSGTFSMSLMVLSTYLVQYIPHIAYTLWILGVILHIMLMIYFTYHFIIHNFNITTVYPSYWIVFVGITMSAITAHVHGLKEIGFIFFIIGFIAMLITLPLMIYRYVKYNRIPDSNKPLICIFTAIFSILIVGYVNSTQCISYEFLTILYIIACIFYIFALYKFLEYRNLSFYPSFSAFTFPFVISALATKETAKILNLNTLIVNIETVIAILIVGYILLRYIIFLKEVRKVE